MTRRAVFLFLLLWCVAAALRADETGEQAKKRKQFRKAYNTSIHADRAEAVKLLEGCDNAEAAEDLVDVVRKDPSAFVAQAAANVLSMFRSEDAARQIMDVVDNRKLEDDRRIALLEALGAMRQIAAYPTFVNAAREKELHLRILGCEGLGTLGEPIPDIMTVLEECAAKGQPYPLRLTAIRALATIPSRRSMLALVEAMETPGRIREVATRGMMLLTGKRDIGLDHDRWLAWLREEGGTFVIDAARVRKSSLEQISLQEMNVDAYDFYGIDFYAKRVLFVIDRSGSMTIPGDLNQTGFVAADISRLEAVKRELIRLIGQLDPSVKFNIIFFSGGMRAWERAQLHEATEEKKKAAIRFVQGVDAGGATHTDKVMTHALRFFGDKEEVETIYLLTDGGPFRGGQFLDLDEVRGEIREVNRFRKMQINTIGCFFGADTQAARQLGEPSRGELSDFLEKIAKENWGLFLELR